MLESSWVLNLQKAAIPTLKLVPRSLEEALMIISTTQKNMDQSFTMNKLEATVSGGSHQSMKASHSDDKDPFNSRSLEG